MRSGDVECRLLVVVDSVGIRSIREEGSNGFEIPVESGEVKRCLVGVVECGDVGAMVEGVIGGEVGGLCGLEERQETTIGRRCACWVWAGSRWGGISAAR